MTVEHHQAGAVEDGLELGVDVDLPGLRLAGVVRQLPDAVGAVTAQVGIDQRRGHAFGVRRARPKSAEQLGRMAPQVARATARLGHG